ncbi:MULTISPECIES: hypothetical protein [unclassified Lysobacter]
MSSQNAVKSNNPSHLFASNSSKNKNQNRSITSDHIADQLAAFKKSGGRIEVLGNTPLRANVTAFRSKGNSPAKTRTADKADNKATG